jgi:hypothetical protein
MTELKLTDEERRLLALNTTPERADCGTKALRIIDAQAAALDRVRAESHPRVRDPWRALHNIHEVVEALAAAPEHTGPTTDWVEVLQAHVDSVLIAEGKLAAANARVAELARRLDEALAEVRERAGEASAANARADAAEAQSRRIDDRATGYLSRAQRAESERDEWRTKCEAAEAVADAYQRRCEAAERDKAALAESNRGLAGMVDRAESERDEWKGKADAAEQKALDCDKACDLASERADRSESERDEWRAKCEAAELDNANLLQTISFDVRAITAESEAAALRAEVDMQRRRADHHQGAAEALRCRLSTTTELLRAASLALPAPWPLPREIGLAIQAALSAAPAPTAPARRPGRAVLEAMTISDNDEWDATGPGAGPCNDFECLEYK